MRLCGPMQAWGTQSRFTDRDTGREPSKSGVVGLLACALGRPRDAEIADLAALAMSVRVDREGRPLRDFHTAQRIRRASGELKKKEDDTAISTRHYLADADFLVALEGDAATLGAVAAALRRPAWPMFLGRKACVPAVPVWLPDGGPRDEPATELFARYPLAPWHPPARPGATPAQLRVVLEAAQERGKARVGEPRLDAPVSFEPRRFAIRHVVTKFIDPPTPARPE